MEHNVVEIMDTTRQNVMGNAVFEAYTACLLAASIVAKANLRLGADSDAGCREGKQVGSASLRI